MQDPDCKVACIMYIDRDIGKVPKTVDVNDIPDFDPTSDNKYYLVPYKAPNGDIVLKAAQVMLCADCPETIEIAKKQKKRLRKTKRRESVVLNAIMSRNKKVRDDSEERITVRPQVSGKQTKVKRKKVGQKNAKSKKAIQADKTQDCSDHDEEPAAKRKKKGKSNDCQKKSVPKARRIESDDEEFFNTKAKKLCTTRYEESENNAEKSEVESRADHPSEIENSGYTGSNQNNVMEKPTPEIEKLKKLLEISKQREEELERKLMDVARSQQPVEKEKEDKSVKKQLLFDLQETKHEANKTKQPSITTSRSVSVDAKESEMSSKNSDVIDDILALPIDNEPGSIPENHVNRKDEGVTANKSTEKKPKKEMKKKKRKPKLEIKSEKVIGQFSRRKVLRYEKKERKTCKKLKIGPMTKFSEKDPKTGKDVEYFHLRYGIIILNRTWETKVKPKKGKYFARALTKAMYVPKKLANKTLDPVRAGSLPDRSPRGPITPRRLCCIKTVYKDHIEEKYPADKYPDEKRVKLFNRWKAEVGSACSTAYSTERKRIKLEKLREQRKLKKENRKKKRTSSDLESDSDEGSSDSSSGSTSSSGSSQSSGSSSGSDSSSSSSESSSDE